MQCPHCDRSIGTLSKGGEHRIRGLKIILVDPDTGRVHGPCKMCDGDITLANGTGLRKHLRPGLRL